MPGADRLAGDADERGACVGSRGGPMHDDRKAVARRRQDAQAVAHLAGRRERHRTVVGAVTAGDEGTPVVAAEGEAACGAAAGGDLRKRCRPGPGEGERPADRELCRTLVALDPCGGVPGEVEGVGVCWPSQNRGEDCKNERYAFHTWSTPRRLGR